MSSEFPIYVASRTTRAGMWRAHRQHGVNIRSSWIDEAGAGQTADLSELWPRIVNEVLMSCGLVLYAEPEDFPLKGALVEVGMALALGKPIAVVLPGVQVEPISYRPIGSWVRHPNVVMVATVVAGIAYLREHAQRAAFGKRFPLADPPRVTCTICQGLGAIELTGARCQTCGGIGSVVSFAGVR